MAQDLSQVSSIIGYKKIKPNPPGRTRTRDTRI